MALTSSPRSGSSASRPSPRKPATRRADAKGARKPAGSPSGGIFAGVRNAVASKLPSGSGGPSRPQRVRKGPRVKPQVIIAVVAGLIVAGAITFVVLLNTPVFQIQSIIADPTEHLTPETIAQLAEVEEGTTLLTVDEDQVRANLSRNPWVGSVDIIREYPNQLRIVVHEREVGAIVLMGSGTLAWNLGTDGVWIEPMNLTVPDGASAADVAYEHAAELGARLVTDVPASTAPKAGEVAEDECVLGVLDYLQGFSPQFAATIVRFSASSEQSIGCTLESGVTVSLGEPVDIAAKESVIREILAEYPEQVTYINVRVPSRPSFRKVGLDTVQAGTGETG